MVGRAAVNITGANQSYFFQDDKYVKINWKPRSGGDSIQFGPTEFAKEWHTLKEAGFGWIDAILPIPFQEHRAYFFCGNQYVRIDYVPGTSTEKILGGVRSIADGWPSLKKAGFSHVDGALMVPGKRDEAYFFNDDQYCHVRFKEGQNDDELLSGPKAIWSQIQLSTIDTIIPEPGSANGVYAFSGSKYVHFKINAGEDIELIGGAPGQVAPYWLSLHNAGFY